jgi:hypothetical protein
VFGVFTPNVSIVEIIYRMVKIFFVVYESHMHPLN